MRWLLCLLWVLGCWVPVLGQTLESRIFRLNHRLAEATVQMVEPLLSSQGTVLPDARLQRLIVRDLPDNLDQVQRLLEVLDQPAPHVRISVQMEGQSLHRGQLIGLDRNSGSAVFSEGEGTTTTLQTLLVMSGERGRIVMARDVLSVEPFLGLCRQEGLLPPGLVLNSVTTGFAVEPIVVGEMVRLTITPWMSFLGPSGRVEVLADGASTQVALRSGQEQTIVLNDSGSSFRGQIVGLILASQRESVQSSGRLTVRPEIVEL